MCVCGVRACVCVYMCVCALACVQIALLGLDFSMTEFESFLISNVRHCGFQTFSYSLPISITIFATSCTVVAHYPGLHRFHLAYELFF